MGIVQFSLSFQRLHQRSGAGFQDICWQHISAVSIQILRVLLREIFEFSRQQPSLAAERVAEGVSVAEPVNPLSQFHDHAVGTTTGSGGRQFLLLT